MSDNAVTVFDPANVQVPAHIAAAAAAMGTNIVDKSTVPSLSYKGKVWSIHIDGNETKLARPNAEGDMEPIQTFRGVVLGYNPVRGRAFYLGAYDPDATRRPICWSSDGSLPDASLPDALPALPVNATEEQIAEYAKTPVKQSATCATCPRAVKGSKITEQGKSSTECGTHRMLSLVPSFKLDFDPLRLKLAVTSDWDKDIVEHGWFAWQQYVDFLKSRGIPHTALVVTKMKFDQNQAYPKVLFSVDRFLSEAEMAFIQPVTTSDKVRDMLTEKWTAAGVDGTPNQGAEPDPVAAQAAAAALAAKNQADAVAKAQAEAAAKAQAEAEAEAKALAEQTAAAAAKAAAVLAEATPATGANGTLVVPDDDGGDEAMAALIGAAQTGVASPTKPVEEKPAVKPTATTTVPADVADLLAQWKP